MPKSIARPSGRKSDQLRKVTLEFAGEKYAGTIRNISTTGAMIEGLWNVPPGTVFSLRMAKDHVIEATSRWAKDDRMGVEFALPLEVHDDGRVSVLPPRTERPAGEAIRLRKSA